jgi:hypothetical protein
VCIASHLYITFYSILSSQNFNYTYPVLLGTGPPGTYNPLEVLPTRLGLSMRTAENTGGGSYINAASSTHLGPGPSNSSDMEERHAAATTEVTAKPQSQPGPSKPATEDTSMSKEPLTFHRYTVFCIYVSVCLFISVQPLKFKYRPVSFNTFFIIQCVDFMVREHYFGNWTCFCLDSNGRPNLRTSIG